MLPLNNSNLPWKKPNGASLGSIPNEDSLHHSLGRSVLLDHNTDLEMQQIIHLKRNATAGMLHTGSSIGRAFEANDFAITDHLEEQRQKNDNSPERRSELWFLRTKAKARMGTYLASIENKMYKSRIGGGQDYGGYSAP